MRVITGTFARGAKIALVTEDNGDTGAGESDSFVFVPAKAGNEISRS